MVDEREKERKTTEQLHEDIKKRVQDALGVINKKLEEIDTKPEVAKVKPPAENNSGDIGPQTEEF